jgi:hypothetical protein
MLMQKVTPATPLNALAENLGQGAATQPTQAQTSEEVTQSAFSEPLHSQVTPSLLINHDE